MRWNGSLSLVVIQAASSFFLMSAGRPAGATSPPMLRGATSKPCSFTVGTSGIDGLRLSREAQPVDPRCADREGAGLRRGAPEHRRAGGASGPARGHQEEARGGLYHDQRE